MWFPPGWSMHGFEWPKPAPDPNELSATELESLVLVAEGKAWKVQYSRLETLINKGLVNSMGTKITKLGETKLPKKT